MLYKNFHPEDAPFFLSATGFRFLVSTVSVSASSEEADDSTDVRVATVDDVDDSSPEVASLMIRDPHLDELLAAHRQFGGTSALQAPAGFLRNAAFEGPGR